MTKKLSLDNTTLGPSDQKSGQIYFVDHRGLNWRSTLGIIPGSSQKMFFVFEIRITKLNILRKIFNVILCNTYNRPTNWVFRTFTIEPQWRGLMAVWCVTPNMFNLINWTRKIQFEKIENPVSNAILYFGFDQFICYTCFQTMW